MKNNTRIKLSPLENFDKIIESFASNFSENHEKSSKSCQLKSEDGKHSFEILIRSVKVTDEIESWDNLGQLHFTGQLMKIIHISNTCRSAETIFGANVGGERSGNPFLTGYLTTRYGDRKTFFESDVDITID